MKYSSLAFFIFFSLLLVSCSFSYARKEPGGDYWKSVMKDQPMPKALQDLLHQDPDAKKMNYFNKDFDMKSNVIIYHGHSDHQKENPGEGKKSVKGPSNTQQVQKDGLN